MDTKLFPPVATISVGKKFWFTDQEERNVSALCDQIQAALSTRKPGYRVLVVTATKNMFKIVREAVVRSHAS